MIITVPAGASCHAGAVEPDSRSQAVSYVLHERASKYHGAGAGALSIKSFFAGQASYTIGRGRFVVDDGSYLIVNEDQPYTITIESETDVESFCLFFAPGFAEEVRRTLVVPDDRLLLEPAPPPARPALFFERTYSHDLILSPTLLGLRAAITRGRFERAWLHEQLHVTMQRLLQVHEQVYQEVERLPAARAATRAEVYRRLHWVKDYVAASFAEPLTLADLAIVADMSSNHLLRMFKQVFRQTPYQYITALRLEHAQRLLRDTNQPVTEICFAVGFESLGSFSWLFRRHIGVSPAAYRRRTR